MCGLCYSCCSPPPHPHPTPTTPFILHSLTYRRTQSFTHTHTRTPAFLSGNRTWKPALSEYPTLMPTLDVYSIYSGTDNWSFDKSNDLSGFALALTLILFCWCSTCYITRWVSQTVREEKDGWSMRRVLVEGTGSSRTTVNPRGGATALAPTRSTSDPFSLVTNLHFEYKMIDKRSFLG